MLLEIAVGDAYGAGLEYVPREIIDKNNNLRKYLSHQKYKTIPGTYTDDTQMALGVAELLLEDKEFTPLNIATKFVEVFKRDERAGYAQGFYNFLKEVKTGEEFLEKINPTSEKNGGAMRASPIGYLPKIRDVISHAEIQASVTHNTFIGKNSAAAAALMAHYFIYNLGDKKNLGEFISEYVPGEWNTPWKGEVGAKGFIAVRAAITAMNSSNSLSEILKACIDFGGDVDTVAAIALGSASCSKEIEQDLPDKLINSLENSNFGKDYLIELDKRLKQKFRIKNVN